ncbi:MAG: hypothetical protein R3B82_29640 [Sandaracinaceae bacterium]
MRHLASGLTVAALALSLVVLADGAAADAPPPPPTPIQIRGIGAAVEATDVPDHADFEVSNDSGAAVTIAHLALSVWDGGATHPAMIRQVTRNGRRISGPLSIPAGGTVRVIRLEPSAPRQPPAGKPARAGQDAGGLPVDPARSSRARPTTAALSLEAAEVRAISLIATRRPAT